MRKQNKETKMKRMLLILMVLASVAIAWSGQHAASDAQRRVDLLEQQVQSLFDNSANTFDQSLLEHRVHRLETTNDAFEEILAWDSNTDVDGFRWLVDVGFNEQVFNHQWILFDAKTNQSSVLYDR
jgi:hypothetical protein